MVEIESISTNKRERMRDGGCNQGVDGVGNSFVVRRGEKQS